MAWWIWAGQGFSRFPEKARPMIAIKEILQIEETVKADARFQKHCAAAPARDLENVCVDPWTVGDFNIPMEQGPGFSSASSGCECFRWTFLCAPGGGLHAFIDVSTLE